VDLSVGLRRRLPEVEHLHWGHGAGDEELEVVMIDQRRSTGRLREVVWRRAEFRVVGIDDRLCVHRRDREPNEDCAEQCGNEPPRNPDVHAQREGQPGCQRNGKKTCEIGGETRHMAIYPPCEIVDGFQNRNSRHRSICRGPHCGTPCFRMHEVRAVELAGRRKTEVGETKAFCTSGSMNTLAHSGALFLAEISNQQWHGTIMSRHESLL
jgi:hypothetical protein